MSQTEARGMADATRWIGVAASMSDYLDQWLTRAASERLPPPKGTVGAAKRFLSYVLDGIALNRRDQPARRVPTMVGLSNLTIAVEVLTALPDPQPKNLDAVEESMREFLQLLTELERAPADPSISVEVARSLRTFFEELQRQGGLARYAEFAHGERPLS
jgi:hypothetical protein